jgi:hypothetical protein
MNSEGASLSITGDGHSNIMAFTSGSVLSTFQDAKSAEFPQNLIVASSLNATSPGTASPVLIASGDSFGVHLSGSVIGGLADVTGPVPLPGYRSFRPYRNQSNQFVSGPCHGGSQLRRALLPFGSGHFD